MPVAPTIRMRTLARRWLTDEVLLTATTFAADTRPLGKATETTTDRLVMAALIREQIVDLTDSVNVRRNLREFVVWVDDEAFGVLLTDTSGALTDDDDALLTADAATAYTPVPDLRCEILGSTDETLVGRVGQVITVSRDSIRAVRRLTVRIGNDE